MPNSTASRPVGCPVVDLGQRHHQDRYRQDFHHGQPDQTGNATLATSTTLASTSGTVGFGAQIDGTSAGGQSLTITGNASFGGDIGDNKAPSTIAVSGTTSDGAGFITTSGGQTYTGAVTLTANRPSTPAASSTLPRPSTAPMRCPLATTSSSTASSAERRRWRASGSAARPTSTRPRSPQSAARPIRAPTLAKSAR